jgi:hypothetical protein
MGAGGRVAFQTQNPNLGKCLAMKDVGKFYGHLVYFVVTLVYFPRFGMLYKETSGNPEWETRLECYFTLKAPGDRDAVWWSNLILKLGFF